MEVKNLLGRLPILGLLYSKRAEQNQTQRNREGGPIHFKYC